MAAIFFKRYGLREVNMEQARNMLSTALGMPFKAHDSEWYGDYYLAWRHMPEDEKIRLFLNENQDPHRWGTEPQDFWNEPEHSDCGLLIDTALSSEQRAREVEAAIRGAFRSEQLVLISPRS